MDEYQKLYNHVYFSSLNINRESLLFTVPQGR